jgi:hypothetical protein
MDMKGKMSLKMKTNKPNKLGRLPRKTGYKKLKIINIFDNLKINQKTSSIPKQFNKTTISKIEQLKSSGLMYSNILKFR